MKLIVERAAAKTGLVTTDTPAGDGTADAFSLDTTVIVNASYHYGYYHRGITEIDCYHARFLLSRLFNRIVHINARNS